MFPSGISVTLRLSFSFCSFFFPPPPSFVRTPLHSRAVTNETKIKCKWKFIAAGDRRRFRTFKYFINFLLLVLLFLRAPRGSQERPESTGDDGRKETKHSQKQSEDFALVSIFFISSNTNIYRSTRKWKIHLVKYIICTLLITNYTIDFVAK